MVKKYNTGKQKDLLINNGLIHLNKVGYQNFSVREVARISGVSHAAPYKHFKSKAELLAAINRSVMERFKAALLVTINEFKDNPQIRLAELGKKYVQYMVENPEHMKFLFFTARKQGVVVHENSFEYTENSPFAIFKDAATGYLDSISANTANYATDILSILSVVHGISVLIVEQSITFHGDYMQFVSDMIYNRLRS